MTDFSDNPIDADSDESAALRRWLASAEAEEQQQQVAPDMPREEALLRLADRLPDDAFASIHLAEVALTNRDVAADIRAGRPARVSREWSVLITAPGYSHAHGGDQLAAVVEQALADYHDFRAHRDAEDWARAAVPDQSTAAAAVTSPEKPPKLVAPGTAQERQQQQHDREKDAG
jgi:hypothetical protein